MSFLTWFRESRRRRCAHRGHPLRPPVERRYLVYPSELHGFVADEIKVRQERCACGELAREQELERVPLSGLSMPSDDWAQLRRHGRLPI